MLFPTFTFACFFLAVLVVHWTIHDRPGWWRLFILGASYVFYGYWDWRFCFLLAGSTVGNQLLALAADRGRTDGARHLVAVAAVALNLAVLGFFKYYEFFVRSLRDTLGRLGVPHPPLLEILLPVGVSFFTFQALSYVLDVRRGQLRPAPLVDFAVYLSFFPHLVAGPIVRASEFLPQLRDVATRRRVDLSRAAFLIGGGLFKKVVVSSYLSATIVDPVFANPGRHSSLDVILAVYGYAIQIYADFSGYTDIAIGLALLLGFRFPANFDRPYSAASIQDFWRRWHMTLSRWLRDYLYVGLGGNQGGPSRRDRNLLLTMLLGGLWHGAAWTFVVWGTLQGVGLVLERRSWERREALGRPRPSPWAGRLLTFHFICLGWVFFRAPSVGGALDVLGQLLTGWGQPTTAGWLLVGTIAAALAVQYVPRRIPARAMALASAAPVGVLAALTGAALVVIDLLGPDGVAPFIYFQF